MSKITLNDSGLDIVVKLSEGNPGAVSVITQLFQATDVDPDSALGPLGAVLALDTHKLYGSLIWMLYKDVCGHHIGKMIATLRAVQLGFMSETELFAAINGERLPDGRLDEFIAKVQERLPNFEVDAALKAA